MFVCVGDDDDDNDDDAICYPVYALSYMLRTIQYAYVVCYISPPETYIALITARLLFMDIDFGIKTIQK